MNFMGKILIPLCTLIFILSVTKIFVLISEENRLVKHMEKTTGCEYLGHPKGVRGVGTFDCNGDIVTKRMN